MILTFLSCLEYDASSVHTAILSMHCAMQGHVLVTQVKMMLMVP